MDAVVEFQERIEGGAVGRRDQLDGIWSDPDRAEGLADDLGEDSIGVNRFLSAAQD